MPRLKGWRRSLAVKRRNAQKMLLKARRSPSSSVVARKETTSPFITVNHKLVIPAKSYNKKFVLVVGTFHLRAIIDGFIQIPEGKLSFGFLSIPGASAAQLKTEVENIVLHQIPEAVCVVAPSSDSTTNLTISEVTMDFQWLLASACTQWPKAKVFVLDFTPLPTAQGNQQTLIRQAYVRVAKQTGIPYLPVADHFPTDWLELWGQDGIHLSENDGMELLVQLLWHAAYHLMNESEPEVVPRFRTHIPKNCVRLTIKKPRKETPQPADPMKSKEVQQETSICLRPRPASMVQQTSSAKRFCLDPNEDRKVTLGWFHEGARVKKQEGGGMRTLAIPKKSKRNDILQYAMDVFFPDGLSIFGRSEAFIHYLLDYKQDSVLDEAITVEELHSAQIVLRFYLCTWSLADEGDKDLTEAPPQWFDSFLDPMENDEDDASIHELPLKLLDENSCVTSSATPPVSDAANSSSAPSKVSITTIKLHRVRILEEMIDCFKDAALLKHTVKYTYIDEKGASTDCVSRDVYSSFWTEFMDRTAEGEELRVPSLSPQWQEDEWKSIGRILLKGFQEHKYYPCRLAPVFTVALVFGEKEVTDDLLLQNLLQFLSQSDRDLVTTALKQDLEGEDREDLLDLLVRLEVTIPPTQANLKDILLKVAHEQLIEKPNHAAEKMALTAGCDLRKAFARPQDILEMYEDKKPTVKKLLRLLDASPVTEAEKQSLRFLQQYIRGRDHAGLRRMLRFITGADIICVDKVQVLFTPTPADGLSRQPVARTCGPVLVLPCSYTTYPQLRTDMDKVLAEQSYFRFNVV